MARNTKSSGEESYIDTGAFIAALDRSDSHHLQYARLFVNPPRLVTSSLVIAEGHGWFLRRYDQRKALDFLRFIEALKPLTTVAFTVAGLEAAAVLLKKFADHPLTLADTHGLLLMGERRIKSCWSTDRHLSLTGATLVN